MPEVRPKNEGGVSARPANPLPEPTPTWPGWDILDPEFSRIAWGLFAAGFATFLVVFDAQAMLPVISQSFGVGTATAALTVSATTLGLAVSVLVWADVADRVGRVRAMRISLVSALVLSLSLGLAEQLWQLIALRGLLGLALGAVPGVAMAYLAEELVAFRVSAAAGIFVAGNTVGGIVGRLLGGTAAALWGWQTAFLLVGLIAVAMAVVFFRVLPPARGFVAGSPSRYPPGVRILFQLRDPVMLGLYAQGFLLMGAFAAVYNFLGYRLTGAPFGIPAAWAGLVFLAYFAGTVASRIGGGLAARWGHLRVILAGIAIQLTGAMLLLSDNLPLTLLGLAVFTIGCFTAHPAASGLTGQRAQLGRAQATALYQLAWLGGTALFGWLAGLGFDRWGWAAVPALVVGLCLVAAGAAWTGLHTMADRRPVPATI